jgi:hypothetical protein
MGAVPKHAPDKLSGLARGAMRPKNKSRHDVTRNGDNMTKEHLVSIVEKMLEGTEETATVTVSAGWRRFSPEDRRRVTVVVTVGVFADESCEDEI